LTVGLELSENVLQPVPILDDANWYAIWTRSHSEQLVADQLLGKGLDVFLPKMSIWSRRGGVRHVIQVPMFSGYVFLHEDVNKNTYIEVLKARGVVRILGERWDRLSPISDMEIDGLRQAVDARLDIMPHPYLQEGQRVRITDGPLTGVEGLLVQNRLKKGLLVLSVELLRRSVAVQIDCMHVVPA
jgi:transcription termination/antitermination protein NusG